MLKSESGSIIGGLLGTEIRLSSLLDEIPVGVLIVDRSRRVVFMNRALEVMTGFDLGDVSGIPCHHVMRYSVCDQACPVAGEGMMDAPVVLEGDMINRDRKRLSIRVTWAPLMDVRGELVGYAEMVEDTACDVEASRQFQQGMGFDQLLGRSPKMEELFRIIPVISGTDSSVLITGDTGTGKDVLAEVIHKSSKRSRGSFIKINCGALPETLLESELFGHIKGAFTGAIKDKPGYIRLAHNGSLYLTEIGDLPLSLQVKLLTFLDDKMVYQLGSTRGFHADVRIIAATHRNLEEMVRQGMFREDLFYRLNVVRLHLPPLRERGEDIALLMDHFLKTHSAISGKRLRGFSDSVRGILLQYHYPGNVRELSNIIEYAVNISQDSDIRMEHLPAYMIEARAADNGEHILAEAESGSPPDSGVKTAEHGAGINWNQIERKLIVEALLKSRGRKTRAAELLGWCRSTLWRKMKQYQLD